MDDSDSKKRVAVSGADGTVETKRMKGVEHDLTVIVGGQEFHHYSSILRCASDYFDRMLSTPMKEGTTMVVNFPTKEPSEWREVYKFMDPRSSRRAKITNRNVGRLLPWFHELDLPDLMEECDEVLSRMIANYETVQAERTDIKRARLLMKDLVNQVKISMFYNLKKAFVKGIAVLKHLVENEPSLFDHVSCPRLLDVLENDVARESLWPSIRRKLVTKRLLTSSAQDVLDHPFAKDLLMIVLAKEGDYRCRRGC